MRELHWDCGAICVHSPHHRQPHRIHSSMRMEEWLKAFPDTHSIASIYQHQKLSCDELQQHDVRITGRIVITASDKWSFLHVSYFSRECKIQRLHVCIGVPLSLAPFALPPPPAHRSGVRSSAKSEDVATHQITRLARRGGVREISIWLFIVYMSTVRWRSER